MTESRAKNRQALFILVVLVVLTGLVYYAVASDAGYDGNKEQVMIHG